jgi:hypothetical protein
VFNFNSHHGQKLQHLGKNNNSSVSKKIKAHTPHQKNYTAAAVTIALNKARGPNTIRKKDTLESYADSNPISTRLI